MACRRRELLVGLGALVGAAACAGSGGCAASVGHAIATSRRPATIRVMTLNLAHGRGRAFLQTSARRPEWFRRNLDAIASVIVRERPDVIALQEAELGSRWAGDFDHASHLAERSGYGWLAATPHVLEPGRFRYGTALLARAPMIDRGGAGFASQGAWAKGYTTARVEIGGAPLVAVSVHLDFARAARRRAQADELAHALSGIDEPLVVLGDLNATLRNRDSVVTRLRDRLGLRTFGSPTPPTFPATARVLDWVLVSRQLEFSAYRVLTEDRLSDHRAVVADLRAII